MLSRNLRRWAMLAGVLTAAALARTPPASAEEAAPGSESRPIARAEFDRVHQLIRPQPGESRWMEIEWYPNVWEARQKAIAEGKPMFLWAGSGGAPAAGC